MSDQRADGRRFRILNIVEDYSRECPAQIVDFSITGARLARLLEPLAETPKQIVVDNGPEFTSKAMSQWAQRAGVQWHCIEPGKPIQNAFVEGFNGKFRDACLHENWFTSIMDARHMIDAWRLHDNRVRPHSALGYLTLEQFRWAGTNGYGKDGRALALSILIAACH